MVSGLMRALYDERARPRRELELRMRRKAAGARIINRLRVTGWEEGYTKE